jgi:hypothetical protein
MIITTKAAFRAAVAATLAFVPSVAEACTSEIFKCSLQADSVPSSQPWTEPARFAYTFNKGGQDSYAIDVTGKAMFDLGLATPVFALGELAWHRNNQQKKRQSNFQAATGLHFEFENTPAAGPITSRSGLYSVFMDAKVGYSRKAIYADPSTAACQSDPDAVFCHTQHLESVRGTLDVSPFFPGFESEQKRKPVGSETPGRFEGPAVAHSFGIVGTLFGDKILNNKIDPTTGVSIRGAVTGLRGQASIALSPKATNYRLIFRASAQMIHALSRADGRTDFDPSTHLISASLDYDLGRSSLVTKCGEPPQPCPPTFRPAVGVTWTHGSDPLAGREKQRTIVVGLKVSFK